MSTSSPRCLTFILGLCFVLAGIGVDRAEPEKIPRDKVIHPLLEGVSQPELISEPRKNPIYPEKWRKLHLGARVILQGVIEKTGSVGEIAPIKTEHWVEADCGKESGDAAGKGCGDPGKTKPDGPTEKEPGKQAFPSEAGHDFEAAAVKASGHTGRAT